MSNYNDDCNDSAASGVGSLISPGRENKGLPKIREIQLGLMASALEELAGIIDQGDRLLIYRSRVRGF